jgi:hypothetical protein
MLRLLIGTALSLALAACGGGGPSGPGARQAASISQGIGGSAAVRPGPSANEAYVSGLELRKKGDCKAAVEKVRPVANLGPGYEGAQFALGDCTLQLAADGNAAERHEALMWLLRAADAGWNEAQGRLAEVYALGPADTRNLDEAAYWLALYKASAQMPRFGFEPMPPQTLAAVEAALTPAQRDAGATRAVSWQKKLWIPPRTAPERQPGGPGEGRGGDRRMRRGPPGGGEG